MKIAGVICEYNPFHYGHKHQLDTLKKDFDAVVCVMSGSFVQRGDVAVFDKWTRAKAALMSGADLVLELPVAYSLSSAQGFSMGGIKILDSLGIINAVSFGSECGDIEKLTEYAKIMMDEPPLVSKKIKDYVSEGLSFPKARALAYEGILDTDLISSPNNILAIEYICSLLKIHSKIEPVTLPRKAVGYHDLESKDEFASATLLRTMLKNGEDISGFTPFDFDNAETYDLDRLTNIFKYKLITQGIHAFDGISDMEAGLANRFLKSIDKESISEIIDFVKTKRYTRTRLQRILVSMLLGLGGGFENPKYIRILGMTDTGKNVLSQIKNTCTLPIVNKVADFKSDAIIPDITATNLAALCADRPIPQNRDFTTSPVMI